MFEAKFNLSCYHLGRGDLALATQFLEDAKSNCLFDVIILFLASCNLCLSDDPEITEEEKNEELAPMRYALYAFRNHYFFVLLGFKKLIYCKFRKRKKMQIRYISLLFVRGRYYFVKFVFLITLL